MSEVTIKQLFDLGLHFGHLKSYSHPGSKPYVFMVKNGISVIDLEKTKEKLKEAQKFVKELAKQNKTILFIGTKRQASSIIKEQAEKLKMPYIHKRFAGGTLTNFESILKNINRLKELEEKEKELEGKNKKEYRRIIKEKERVSKTLGGLSVLDKLPDALFVVDIVKEKNAVFEANRLNIPIVAIVNTNGDPRRVDYPIPANDNSTKGVEFIVSEIAKAYESGVENKAAKKTSNK